MPDDTSSALGSAPGDRKGTCPVLARCLPRLAKMPRRPPCFFSLLLSMDLAAAATPGRRGSADVEKDREEKEVSSDKEEEERRC